MKMLNNTRATPNDLGLFTEVWNAVHPGCSDMKINLDYAALAGWSLEDIKHALIKHKRNPDAGKYRAEPAHLIAILQAEKTEQKAKDNFYKAPKEEWVRTPESEAIAAENLKKIRSIIEGMGSVVAVGGKFKR